MTSLRHAIASWLLIITGGFAAAVTPAPVTVTPLTAAAGGAGAVAPPLAGVPAAMTVETLQPLTPTGTSGAVQVAKFQIKRTPHITGTTPSADDYRLNIGDVLYFTIYGQDDTNRTVPVDPNGMITYLVIGTLPAAGRTIDDLRQDMQRRLTSQYNYLILTVSPVKFKSQNFTIFGQVLYPGTYPIEGRTTVTTAVCAGRGLKTAEFRNSTIEAHDLAHATLMRRGGQFIPVDFEALLIKGDASQDVELQDGDIINIPSALVRSVYIIGEVGFQRTMGFYDSATLLEVLAEARGVKPTAGDTIIIVRGSLTKPETRTVRISALLSGRAGDVQLQAGDIIYVPPKRFSLLEDMVKAAVSAFANNVSLNAADNVYQQLDPNYNSNKSSVVIGP